MMINTFLYLGRDQSDKTCRCITEHNFNAINLFCPQKGISQIRRGSHLLW